MPRVAQDAAGERRAIQGRTMETYEVLDPSTGQVVQTYPGASDADVSQAVAAVAEAGREWAAKKPSERAAVIRRVAELHLERADELARIIQREMGKPHDDGVGEVQFSAAIYTYYADNAQQFLADEPVNLLDGKGSAVI